MPPRPPRIPAHRGKRDPLRNARLAPRPHTCDEQCTHPVRGETGGLHPTKTRLALLRAVKDGSVRQVPCGDWLWFRSAVPGDYSVVRARAAELLTAGWITDEDPTQSTYVTASLTARGRQILAEHGEDR